MVCELNDLCADPGWVTHTENQSLGNVLFMNGYHNGIIFIDKETYGFNPKVRFTAQILHDYIPNPTDEQTEYDESVRQRLFNNPLEDLVVVHFVLRNIGRALFGEAKEMKRALFGLGDSHCGRSSICSAITKSFWKIGWNL